MKSGASIEKIAAELEKSVGAIKHEMRRLGLDGEGSLKFNAPSSSRLDVDGELRSVEEALKALNGALKALETEGLGKTEIPRFRGFKPYAYQAEFIANMSFHRWCFGVAIDCRRVPETESTCARVGKTLSRVPAAARV